MGCCAGKVKPNTDADASPATASLAAKAANRPKAARTLPAVAQDDDDAPGAAPPPDRTAFLQEAFVKMQVGGNGLSSAVFQEHVKSAMMRQYFTHMDVEYGNGDGVLQLDAWIVGSEQLVHRTPALACAPP